MRGVRTAAAKKFVEQSFGSDDEPVEKVIRQSRTKRTSARNENKSPARKSGRLSRNAQYSKANKSLSDSSSNEDAPIVNKTPNLRSSRSAKDTKLSGKQNGKNNNERNESSSENEILAVGPKRNAPAKSSSPIKPKPSTSKSSITPKKKTPEKSAKPKEDLDENHYEVEEILDHKFENDSKFFLIRWKGYGSDVDSWETSRNIHCPALLAKYYEKHPEASISAKQNKKKSNFVPKVRQLKVDEQLDYNSDWDENENYEVERILDVYIHRDNKRDFLIRWKGYSSKSDSWEPEDNLDCEDLIAKFMEKVERIKNVTLKELRPVRSQTQRFTLMTQDSARRLSKRNAGRQRAVYYDCEE